jgi:hypothetical protein
MPNWSLYCVTPLAGLTLGGIVATSATGTGASGSPSTLCDIVLQITWVDGSGTIRRSPRDSEAGRAICGGLGLMGIITELQMQLLPFPSKVLAISKTALSDAALTTDINKWLRVSCFCCLVFQCTLPCLQMTALSLASSTTSSCFPCLFAWQCWNSLHACNMLW